MNAMRVVVGFVLFASLPAWAQKVDQMQNLAQQEFRSLSEDLGAVLSYRPQTPTTPLGLTGFDIGVGVTAAKIKHQDLLERATSDSASSTVLVPTIRVHKGLPLGIDVGAIYAKIPGSNINYSGAELRYALLQGNLAMPAIGLRGSYTRLGGVDQLRVDTYDADLSISKGFAIATPYAGIGHVWVKSDPRGTAAAALRSESFEMNKFFVGIGLNFGLFNLNFEADRTGDVTGFGGKVSLRF
ncbi:MAG: hypothetical protein EXR39_16655 [Betaproteobacteria bacterium]|nr:hypothetical protein [Betaproteobacteria bacterium]